jgi:hypothetical protein
MKRKFTNSILASAVAITTCSTSLFAQNVSIPDANFKNALLSHTPVIDIDGNQEISIVEAQTFSGILNVDDKNISDLTGIEEFTAIIELNCSYNTISSLNLSNNISLTTIKVLETELTSLNVNGITALTLLWCQGNQLTLLNLSSNSSLTDLSCFDNQLTSLNVANGNQDFDRFWAHNNPDLTCIQVENAAYSTSNWLNGTSEGSPYIYDDGVDFSENCTASIDVNGIDHKSIVTLFPNPASENVTISNIEAGSTVVLVDVTGKTVSKVVASSTSFNVETSNFTPGVYFVTVSGLNGTQKLVIE